MSLSSGCLLSGGGCGVLLKLALAVAFGRGRAWQAQLWGWQQSFCESH